MSLPNNISKIKKNANGFNFVETIGSFINNMKFKQGFNQYQLGKDSKDAFIWKALSCIGGEYGEIIYENVLNYLDNASNVDLCKVKALQSLIKVVGVKYDVLQSFKDIPVELANIIDILSINRKYLLDSKTFKDEFIDLLKDSDVIKQNVQDDNALSDIIQADALSNITDSSYYIDDVAYKNFLKKVYNSILTSFVYMQYADAENGLSSQYRYIYEYISDEILAGQMASDYTQYTQYESDIAQLKNKYNISKSFDQVQIVDNIENGYDSIDNYNSFEQEILKYEIIRREATYSSNKTFDPNDVDLGYNLTRYSYYREKKVKEYFKFIEDTYNSMIIEEGIKSNVESPIVIQSYDHNVNYFDINQTDKQVFLSCDPVTNALEVKTSYINAISELLAQQTLAIADIRDQVKLQIRRSYMRGTFLLISYVINEFLKYNISEKYGQSFQTSEGEYLGDIIDKSITNGDNVQLIEYFDSTEYFNITQDVDIKAQNSDSVNDKFWDSIYSKIGVTTEDLPLEEIDAFYKKQLKLEKKGVDDLINFLSIIYEYGANNSYMSRKTGEFNCLIPGREVGDPPYYIGDPNNEISTRQNDILSVNTIHDGIDTYIAVGYPQKIGTTLAQLDDLSNWVSSYFWDEISSANEELKDSTLDKLHEDLDEMQEMSKTFADISSEFEDLKANPKYSYYISQNRDGNYHELTEPKPYFIEKLYNFKLSVEGPSGIIWKNQKLDADLTYVLTSYNDLSGKLYTNLFALSVWPIDKTKTPNNNQTGNKYWPHATTYWPYYSPNFDNELTTVTQDLKSYLIDQAQLQYDGASQHIQNHYNALLGFKDEINQVLQKCNEADAKLNAFAIGVQSRLGIPNNEVIDTYDDITVFTEQVNKIKVEPVEEEDDEGLREITWEDIVVEKNAFWLTEVSSCTCPAVDTSSIKSTIDSLIARTLYPKFPTAVTMSNALVQTARSDFGPCTLAEVVQCMHEEFTEWDEYGIGHKKKWFGDDPRYVPSKYTTVSCVGYLPSLATRPYESDNDSAIKEDILDAYNNAVANLTANVALINNELTCLGYNSINVGTVDIDHVRSATQNAYEQLIDRIDDLKTIIQAGNEATGWLSLVSKDSNLKPYANRLKTISCILDSENISCNIVYINQAFEQIQLSVNGILANNSEYFENYVNNDADRLDKQIKAMSAYMNNTDAQASAEVLSHTIEISSKYTENLQEFNTFSLTLNRKIVESINDDYSYNLSTILYRDELKNVVENAISTYKNWPNWPKRYNECLDYLLSGDYINAVWSQQLSGAIFWLSASELSLENSIRQQIDDKIPRLTAYIEITHLIDTAKSTYASRVKDDDLLLTEKLDQIVDDLQDEINYISSEIPFYDANHEIYLKYNGTDIGYDPFYCYKNTAYSSYQIHPYLYNFVEKSNLVYPLANNFFVSFGAEYEKELYERGIDNILGQYGNIKNLWNSGLFDWTSYQSKYERQANLKNFTAGGTNPNIGFTGLFYPPAVKAFLEDKDAFLQDVQDDAQNSFYHHLNLTDNQRHKIYEQLLAYYPMISSVATAQGTGRLSGEFDIYRYAEDSMGNSIFLLKSYQHLYEQHPNDPKYAPSYHEKRNTPGELWMRIKDHPIAFPAIDLRRGYEDISQYSIRKTVNSYAKDINSYIPTLNTYFKNHERNDGGIKKTGKITRDTIGRYEIDGPDLSDADKVSPEEAQHLRCFYDFETDALNQALLLVVPFRTGNGKETLYGSDYNLNKIEFDNLHYADSSIVIAYLGDHELFNATSDQMYVYNFSTDVYTENQANVDNIGNSSMRINGSTEYLETQYYSEFIGFVKYKIYVYAIFVNKYVGIDYNNLARFSFSSSLKARPRVELRYFGYKCHLRPSEQTIVSEPLVYDIYDWHNDPDRSRDSNGNPLDYTNASHVALGGGNGLVTIGFVTARRQTKSDGYSNNSQIVNFTEYTTQMQSYNAIEETGKSIDWPRSTALIQTKDSQHINIYNSFDSFAQHLVNVNFKFVGKNLQYSSTQYFNLNSDLGYLPQYVDKCGTCHYNNNTALCNATSLNIELLGPEKSDIAFTPVIQMTEDEKYGRVVEDYKEYSKLSAFNKNELTILQNSKSVTYDFNLSSIYVDTLTATTPSMDKDKAEKAWQEFIETPDLLKYKYIIYNRNYMSQPILKGNLSDVLPNGYYYQGAEIYDLLSGDEIIGPNSNTYQNINMTNHIDNISAITAFVEYDNAGNDVVNSNTGTNLPTKVVLSCIVRQPDSSSNRVIEEKTFFMLLYTKNNVKSYQYYHLFENANRANRNIGTVNMDQTWEIDLAKDPRELSDITVDGGAHPFRSINSGQKYNMLSAPLEFKYSEENPINREFPNIDPIDAEDEITIVENDSQSIYYFSIDDYTSLDLNVFHMPVYVPQWISPKKDSNNQPYAYRYDKKINPLLPKYRDFYNRSLVIEATYNLEKKDKDSTEYEIVQYFNYQNFTNPQYVNISWQSDTKQPPDAYVCNSTDQSIKNTYLVLKPGQSGRLDIRLDFIEYQKLKQDAINQSIVGAYSQYIKTYYIMNVSDEKPKFIISRKPFVANEGVEEQNNYELEDAYYAGMTFQYAMMLIQRTRNSTDTTTNLYNYVAMSQLAFKRENGELFDFASNAKVDITDGAGASIVYPNVPSNLLTDDKEKEFFASNLSLNDGNYLSIIIDFGDRQIDIDQYSKWSWFNSHNSSSHIGFIPKKFMMLFSNDKKRWYQADDFSDDKNSITINNYAEAYTGELIINED